MSPPRLRGPLPGSATPPPIQHELLALQHRDDILSDTLHLLFLVGTEARSQASEKVEDGELLFGQAS